MSLKGQASELGRVRALELHRPVVMAPLAEVLPLETVPAVVKEQVQATMAGLAVVEAPDQEFRIRWRWIPLSFLFSNKLESEPNMHF